MAIKIKGNEVITDSKYGYLDRLYIGAGQNDGYFYSDSNGRTAFKGGDFYIMADTSNTYLYSTNTYLGNTTGDTIRIRGNTITGDGGLNILNGAIKGATFGVANTDSTTGKGISLYGGPTAGMATYGISFSGTSTNGTHGDVHGDWATYMSMSDSDGRGWIWTKSANSTSGNVASISAQGVFTSGAVVTGAGTFTGAISGKNATFDNGTSTTVKIMANSTGLAELDVQGGGQGTSSVQVSQDGQHGGGMMYNGDGSPTFASGETADYFSLYTSTAGDVKTVFMDVVHNGINPRFKGTVYVSGDVIAYYSSDERLKENVIKIEGAVDKLKQLNGVTFNWNEKNFDRKTVVGSYDKNIREAGVIAQEVEKVLPEVVTTRDDGYKAVKYEKLVPLLIEAIKEQQVQIDELTKRTDNGS